MKGGHSLNKIDDERYSTNSANHASLDRYVYAHDASHFFLIPQQVIIARNSDEISQLLSRCRRDQTAVTFRSGGTSLSGQAVSDSLLIDVRHGFDRIEVLDEGTRVRVEPGVTLRRVNSLLRKYGTVLGPDPASEVACTIGGVVANNSSGMTCGTQFNSYHTLESVKVVLPSGTILDTGSGGADTLLRSCEPDLFEGLLRLRSQVRDSATSRREIKRQFAIKNTMGYSLNSFLDFDNPSDILAHLIVGSEGTLGFLAEATIRTIPLQRFASTGLMIFPDLATASKTVPYLTKTGASAIELLDSASLRIGRSLANVPSYLKDMDIKDHAAFLIEYRADSEEQLAELLSDASSVLEADMFPSLTLSREGSARDAMWQMRKGLYAAIAGARPVGTTSLLEDIAVPVDRIADTCTFLDDLFAAYGYSDAIIFGHVKDGNLHFMLSDRFEGVRLTKFEEFTEDLVSLVLDQGGTLKAEHGTGRVMAPFVERQFGPDLYQVIREVKNLFDPAGIMNPGVIVTDDSRQHLRNIKLVETVDPQVDRCVDCGFCEPVCPSRRLTLTPRQRIAALREIARAERLGSKDLVRDLERQLTYPGIETCAVDGMCQTTCPVMINTGDVVKTLRARKHGKLKIALWKSAASHWKLTTFVARTALNIASVLPERLVKLANQTLRKLMGNEVVPMWSSDLPRGGISRSRSLVRSERPEIVYFPSCINCIFASPSPGIQKSFIDLCVKVGISLKIPEEIDQLCCGTPWTSKGLNEARGPMEAKVLEMLRRATRDGSIPIVCDAASCSEGLQGLVKNTDNNVQFTVMDIVEFTSTRILTKLHSFDRTTSLVLHPTCSSKRMGIDSHLNAIAQALADKVLVPNDWECCAFAGDRGMLHPELTASATEREALEIATTTADNYVSCNRTCEIAMSRATGSRFSHIVEVLASQVVGGRR